VATTVLKQERIACITVPIVATLALTGIAIAPRVVGDSALALLHDGFGFVSTLIIGSGFSVQQPKADRYADENAGDVGQRPVQQIALRNCKRAKAG
jgi:hypothetical protein